MGQIDWLLIEVSSRKWKYVSQMCFCPTVIKWPELQKSRQVFIYLILFSSTTVWYSTCKWAEEAKSVLISQYFTPSERHTHSSLGDINRLSSLEFAPLLSFLRENCLLISWVALNTLYVTTGVQTVQRMLINSTVCGKFLIPLDWTNFPI